MVHYRTLNLLQEIMVNAFSFSSSTYYEVLSLIYTKHTMWYFDCSCQLTSILVQNLLTLKKNNSCGCFMRINFEKFVVHSTFLIKFRYLLLFLNIGHAHEQIWGHNGNAFNRCTSVSDSCFAGDSSNLFQKVLPAMVGHGTSSKTYNVWFIGSSISLSVIRSNAC